MRLDLCSFAVPLLLGATTVAAEFLGGIPAACGNGEPDVGEYCDDGNASEADACASDCTPAGPFAAYHATIERLMERWSIPGGAVAVSRGGRLVMVRGYGTGDLETGEPVARDALFRTASLSKSVTAVAILRLQELGELGVDDPAFAYLPHLPAAPGASEDPQLGSITLRHLLTHSGGWDRALSGDPMFQSPTIARSLGESGPATASMVIRYMRGRPLDFPPGTRYAYSNFGYAVLGRIIEAVTGEEYGIWVRANVLAPMGISRMQIGATLPEGRLEGEVRYHGYPGQPQALASVFPGISGPVPWPYGAWYLEAMDSHGGWVASAVDLTRFLLSIDGRPTYPDLLSPSSISLLVQRPDLPDWSGSSYWYAMGLAVRPAFGDANWWHVGSLDGTTTIFVRNYAGITWVALFNSRPADPDRFSSDMDSTMWEALDTVSEWPSYDLLPRY